MYQEGEYYKPSKYWQYTNAISSVADYTQSIEDSESLAEDELKKDVVIGIAKNLVLYNANFIMLKLH